MRCDDCGADRPKLDKHHVIPRWKGGSDDRSNIVFICRNCHQDRHDNAEEFERRRAAWTPERRAAHAARMRTWGERNPQQFAERNRKIGAAMQGNMRGKGNSGRPRKGWGNGNEACVSCGRSDRPHKAQSLCNACYLKKRRQP